MERVLKHRFLGLLCLLSLLSSLANSALATTVIMPTDDEMIIGARVILRGKVLSMQTGAEGDRIYTYITLRVKQVLKGAITARKVVIKEEGGEFNGRGTIVFGAPRFSTGEKVFVYLDTRQDGSLRVHEMFLGKFSIISDPETGEPTVVRNAPDSDTEVLDSATHGDTPRGPVTDRMELTAYEAMILDRVAALRDRSDEIEQTYYRHVPVLARPFEYARKSGLGEFEPQWTYISTAHPRWFEPDTGQTVIYHVNPDGAPSSTIMSDIGSAMNAWSTIPGCSMRLATGTSTASCVPSSAENTIIFNNCDGRWSPATCSGVLALGGLGWNSGQTKVINGVTFVKAQAGFVSFNPYAACNFGVACNVQEITTHELGHTLGLGHSEFSDATMYAFAHFDNRCASLRQDDINGALFIYPILSGPLTIVTTSPLPNATTGTSYSQTLTASGGKSPYTWSLATGSGPLPTGLSLSTGGVISGNPSATGTFNFTVQVRDSASSPATVQKAFSITVTQAGVALDSQFVSQTVPANVQPGAQFSANIKFNNTGTSTWSGTNLYFLASQNPALNSTWGGNGVNLSAFSIASGQQLNLTFTGTAPVTPGTYNFQWQMYKNDGTGFFGQKTANVVIAVGTVVGGGSGTDTIGLYSPATSTFFLRNSNSSAPADLTFGYGPAGAGWVPISGDWNGDGVDTVGLYNPATSVFFLRNANSTAPADLTFSYGPAGAGWIPVAGDWNGDGIDTIGLYSPATSTFFLRNSNTSGPADLVFSYGPAGAGWLPIAGDWNGDGTDTIGLYSPATSTFFLRNANSSAPADLVFGYGPAGAGWIPVVGDWNADGTDTIGLYAPTNSTFFLRNANSTAPADLTFSYGPAGAGWKAIVGDWDGQ